MNYLDKDKLHKVAESHIQDAVANPYFDSSSASIMEIPCDNLVDEDGNSPTWQLQLVITRIDGDFIDLVDEFNCEKEE